MKRKIRVSSNIYTYIYKKNNSRKENFKLNFLYQACKVLMQHNFAEENLEKKTNEKKNENFIKYMCICGKNNSRKENFFISLIFFIECEKFRLAWHRLCLMKKIWKKRQIRRKTEISSNAHISVKKIITEEFFTSYISIERTEFWFAQYIG